MIGNIFKLAGLFDPKVQEELVTVVKLSDPTKGKCLIKVVYGGTFLSSYGELEEDWWVEVFPRTHNQYNDHNVEELKDYFSDHNLHHFKGYINLNPKNWQVGQTKTFKADWDIEWKPYKDVWTGFDDADVITTLKNVKRIK